MKIFGCITYSNVKLGPRLIGTKDDWQLNQFSKETMFSIIYDSIAIRINNAVLFASDKDGNSYKILIHQKKQPFYDIHYNGDRYAFCIFLPKNCVIDPKYQHVLDTFDWSKLIDVDGKIDNLVYQYNQILLETITEKKTQKQSTIALKTFS